jgi:4-amino-4-deoxy-L-arabinose transferase-like glycosyltransferase
MHDVPSAMVAHRFRADFSSPPYGMAPMPSDVSTNSRRDVALLVLLCVPLFFVGLGCYDLDMRGEPREGITAWETIHSNFLLPMLNGDRLPEKPLMFPWLASISMRVFGETSEWAMRLPSALMGMGLVLVVRAIGARLLGGRGGLVAATACAGTFLVVSLARRARVDMTLSFFVCLALLQFVAMWQEHEADAARRPSAGRIAVFWLSLTFATLSKGPLGVILPGLAIGSFLLVRRRVAFAWTLCRWWGVLLLVGIAGGWYAHGLVSAGGEFGFRSFLMENVMMFLGEEGGGGHRHGPFYFVPLIFIFGSPWALLLPAALALVVRRARGAWDREPLLLPICWFFGMFVFFSAASGKRADYLLPLLPAASLLVAGALETATTTTDALARRFVTFSAWALAGLGVVVAVLAAILVWAPTTNLPEIVAERRVGPEADSLFSVIESHATQTVALIAAVAVIAAAPAVGLAVRRPAWGVGVSAAAMAVAAPIGLLTYMPEYRGRDSLKAFTAQVLATAGPGATIRTWDDFEPQTLFYANRRMPSLAPRHLDEYLAEPGVGWIFTERCKFDALSPELRARLEVVLESHRAGAQADKQSVLVRRREK